MHLVIHDFLVNPYNLIQSQILQIKDDEWMSLNQILWAKEEIMNYKMHAIQKTLDRLSYFFKII